MLPDFLGRFKIKVRNSGNKRKKKKKGKCREIGAFKCLRVFREETLLDQAQTGKLPSLPEPEA